MKPKTKWKIAAAGILLTLAVLLPEVVSGGWHMIHGRSVVYRGWKVTVPFEWYAVRRGDGMSLERMARFSWNDGPVAVFLPVHFTKQFHFNYDIFAAAQAKSLKPNGYFPVAQRDARIAGQIGRCWTFSSKLQRNQEWIDCIVPEDLTSVDYIGPKACANAFFALIDRIQPVAPAP